MNDTAADITRVERKVDDLALQIKSLVDAWNTARRVEIYNVSSTGFSVRTKSLTSGSSTITAVTAGINWTATY